MAAERAARPGLRKLAAVEVDEGVATLRGTVDSPQAKRTAASLVSLEGGATGVVVDRWRVQS